MELVSQLHRHHSRIAHVRAPEGIAQVNEVALICEICRRNLG